MWSWDDDPAILIDVLRRGGALGIPTESSYALAADPRNACGVEAIFRIKGRAAGQGLPVVIADLEQAYALGVARDAPGLDAIAPLWPAPLSLVVPLARPLPASAGAASIAVRVPAHARLAALLRRLGPLTATSANRTGEPPLLDPAATAELLANGANRVVDDGILPGGAPSTLVRWDSAGLRVLRSGRFSIERLHLEGFPIVEHRPGEREETE